MSDPIRPSDVISLESTIDKNNTDPSVSTMADTDGTNTNMNNKIMEEVISILTAFDNLGVYYCPRCEISLTKTVNNEYQSIPVNVEPSEVYIHIMNHYKSGRQMTYVCQICTASFTSERMFGFHMTTHSDFISSMIEPNLPHHRLGYAINPDGSTNDFVVIEDIDRDPRYVDPIDAVDAVDAVDADVDANADDIFYQCESCGQLHIVQPDDELDGDEHDDDEHDDDELDEDEHDEDDDTIGSDSYPDSMDSDSYPDSDMDSNSNSNMDSNDGTYVCRVCNEVFDYEDELGEHFIRIHGSYDDLSALDAKKQAVFPGFPFLLKQNMVRYVLHAEFSDITKEHSNDCNICCMSYINPDPLDADADADTNTQDASEDNKTLTKPLLLLCCKQLICSSCIYNQIKGKGALICPYCNKNHCPIKEDTADPDDMPALLGPYDPDDLLDLPEPDLPNPDPNNADTDDIYAGNLINTILQTSYSRTHSHIVNTLINNIMDNPNTYARSREQLLQIFADL